jgi:dCTP diphosphatase
MNEPTLSELRDVVRQFRDDRNWAQFHSLKDLAAAIAVEAAELQEIFLWQAADDETRVVAERRDAIHAEVADVLIQVMNFAIAADINLADAVTAKLRANEAKYPVEKAFGRAAKYTDL